MAGLGAEDFGPIGFQAQYGSLVSTKKADQAAFERQFFAGTWHSDLAISNHIRLQGLSTQISQRRPSYSCSRPGCSTLLQAPPGYRSNRSAAWRTMLCTYIQMQ